MRRGEVWTVAGAGEYGGKPRPAVIVQDDGFDATRSVTICALTTNAAPALLVRPAVAPNERNGLRQPSRIMVDKIITVSRRRIGARLGRLDAENMAELDRALLVFLGMAGSPPAPRAAG